MTHVRGKLELIEYEWNPDTELGTFTYQKPGTKTTTVIVREQPVHRRRN